MKGGPNRYDMHNIRCLVEQGKNVEEISSILGIAVEGLKPHVPEVKKDPPKKKKKAVTDGEPG